MQGQISRWLQIWRVNERGIAKGGLLARFSYLIAAGKGEPDQVKNTSSSMSCLLDGYLGGA